jgi:hypothetical protein
MEGVLFIPPNRRPEETCAECGRTFRPLRLGDGTEELCDTCYEAQFEPRRLHHWQKPGRSHPHP